MEPRSHRPHRSPQALDPQVVELIIKLRTELADNGLDAGPVTISWHLQQHHRLEVAPVTVWRYLTKSGLVTPQPKKRPKTSYLRFQADQPNETWQSDFTHWRLQDRSDTEIITFLDDCSRLALRVSAHQRISGAIVVDEFHKTAETHGYPASVLTDNEMVYTAGSPLAKEDATDSRKRYKTSTLSKRTANPTTRLPVGK